jgi:hypothetical protein
MGAIFFLVCCHLVNPYAKLKNEQNRSKIAQKVSKNEKYIKKWRENAKKPHFNSRLMSMAQSLSRSADQNRMT